MCIQVQLCFLRNDAYEFPLYYLLIIGVFFSFFVCRRSSVFSRAISCHFLQFALWSRQHELLTRSLLYRGVSTDLGSTQELRPNQPILDGSPKNRSSSLDSLCLTGPKNQTGGNGNKPNSSFRSCFGQFSRFVLPFLICVYVEKSYGGDGEGL